MTRPGHDRTIPAHPSGQGHITTVMLIWKGDPPWPGVAMGIGEESTITIGLAVVIFGGLAALWWRIDSRIGRARDELAAYKLDVAEKYATKLSATQAVEKAVTVWIEEIRGLRADMKDGLNKLGDRIGRMENHVLSGRRDP